MTRLCPLFLTLLAACGGKAREPQVPAIETTSFAPSLGVDLAAMTRTRTGLYYRDLVTGQGPEVRAGQTVAVRYIGSLPDGRQFDATRPGDDPFVFVPGAGQVIGGWDEGVPGMRVGGRRLLVLPPELGYGSRGAGPIPPNAILIFTVEVISAQ